MCLVFWGPVEDLKVQGTTAWGSDRGSLRVCLCAQPVEPGVKGVTVVWMGGISGVCGCCGSPVICDRFSATGCACL